MTDEYVRQAQLIEVTDRLIRVERAVESIPTISNSIASLMTEKTQRETMEKVVLALLKSIPVTIGICASLAAAVMWFVAHWK